MRNRPRLLAKVGISTEKARVHHYRGLPPELTDGEAHREPMEKPDFVIIENRSDGIFLTRYDSGGNPLGDTWHVTIEEAKEQANYEFGIRQLHWISISDDITDVVAFGAKCKV